MDQKIQSSDSGKLNTRHGTHDSQTLELDELLSTHGAHRSDISGIADVYDGKRSTQVDKGYSWVIMIAIFGLEFLLVGYLKSQGILFVEIQNILDSSSTETSAIISSMEVTCFLSGFLVMAVLVKIISPRICCLIGSLFLTVGMSGSIWLPEPKIELLCLTQGVFIGLSISFAGAPPFVEMTKYFDKRRVIASSISTCGASLGGVAFPMLYRLLLDNYGFKWSVLIMSGVLMNCFVFSLLLVPFGHRSGNRSSRVASGKPKRYEDVQMKDAMDNLEKETEELNKDMLVEKFTDKLLDDEDINFYNQKSGNPESKLNLDEKASEFSKKDVLVEKLTDKLMNYHDIDAYAQESGNTESGAKSKNRKHDDAKLSNRCMARCKSKLTNSLTFWLLGGFFFCATTASILAQTYLPALAEERGLSKDEGAFLLSMMNILDIPAHLIPGALVHFRLIRSMRFLCVPFLIVGVMGTLTLFFQSYSTLLLLSITYGLFLGNCHAVQPIVLLEFLGQENYATASGFCLSLTSLGPAVSYLLCGAMKDITETYDYTYMYIGVLHIMSSVILAACSAAKRYDVRRKVL